jgi:disulfide bond formation protein DsbB
MNAKLTQPIWHRYVPVALLLIAVTALGSAYTAEFAYSLEPCVLCMYQRIPFAVLGVLGLLAYLFEGRVTMAVVTALGGIVLLIGAGIASYHVGVEQHWWASVASCGDGASNQALSMNEFHTLLRQKPEKACDELDWTLFGISMATYNVAFSSVLGLGGLWVAIKMRTA